jgi:hypothetical protein
LRSPEGLRKHIDQGLCTRGSVASDNEPRPPAALSFPSDEAGPDKGKYGPEVMNSLYEKAFMELYSSLKGSNPRSPTNRNYLRIAHENLKLMAFITSQFELTAKMAHSGPQRI